MNRYTISIDREYTALKNTQTVVSRFYHNLSQIRKK